MSVQSDMIYIEGVVAQWCNPLNCKSVKKSENGCFYLGNVSRNLNSIEYFGES